MKKVTRRQLRSLMNEIAPTDPTAMSEYAQYHRVVKIAEDAQDSAIELHTVANEMGDEQLRRLTDRLDDAFEAILAHAETKM